MVVRVFVAGGSGVVGRRLVPQLVARGHQVTATATGPARLSLLAQLGADGVVMDGLDAVSVGEAVAAARPDAIVHQMTALSAAQMRRSVSGPLPERVEPPGDVELGLEQGACHDHRPSGASLHVPSTAAQLPAAQLPAAQLPAAQLPAAQLPGRHAQRLAHASCQQADQDHLVTWFHRTRNFGRPGRRFPAASTYRSNCTSTDRGEGTVPPRIAPGTARSSTLGVDQPR